MMFIQPVCVILCVLFLQCNGQHTPNNTIFMIKEELYAYSFSCASNQLVALSADKMSLLIYDVGKQQQTASVSLHLPGELLAVTEDGKHLIITHDSYLSVVQKHGDGVFHEYKAKTYPVVLLRHLALQSLRI